MHVRDVHVVELGLRRVAVLVAAEHEHIRADRVLYEAMANGPDPLRLAEILNMHPETVVNYANIAASLLERPVEQAPAGAPTS